MECIKEYKVEYFPIFPQKERKRNFKNIKSRLQRIKSCFL